TIDGRAGYHIYFLIQSLHYLEKEGRLAFIMPADTCEGRFADKLWKWITKHYCLECVCTFKEGATPFPDVDTNALVFFIRNSKPKNTIQWIEVSEAYTDCLLNYVKSEFKEQICDSLNVTNRNLQEALETGLSRPQTVNKSKYQLSDFASVMRGIATGANDFFFLTKDQVSDFQIPNEYIKRAVGRTRDVEGDLVTAETLKELEDKNRPTYLLSIGKEKTSELPKILQKYIQKGEKQELHLKSLIQQRKPWYKMEKREIPPLLFAYLGRRNTRFIKNEANVLPLTGFLCVYPHKKEKSYINKLWKILNHEDTIKNLRLVGKSYGSGAIKVEPSGLKKLPIPEYLVKEFQLEAKNQERNGQLRMFKELEPQIKYQKIPSSKNK
ncbi:MAG: SAM-dependent methyltransferase, partial [Bacteroidota bacterium]